MQREENKNVTHPLKKRRARSLVGFGIWVVSLANAKFWSEKPHTHPRTMLAQKRLLVSFLLSYKPSSHVSSSSTSSARAPIQIVCPAMTTTCLSNEVTTIP